MPEKISLSTNLVNGILQFLGGQSYQSVAGLISQIQEEARSQIQQIEDVAREQAD